MKYKKGDRCRIVNNLLRPECIGQTVVIESVFSERDGRVLYNAKIEDERYPDMACVCAETCIEPLVE